MTPAHNSHKRDQAAFFREGGSTLFPEELELLGDLHGQALAHVQCNCGQDSLSLARRGAKVTGVDISDAAIEFAERLSAETSIEANFVRSDALEWLETASGRFDTVFSSYGCVGWIADLERWARGIERVLVSGGRFVYVEFHPLVWSLSAEGLTADSYFLQGPIEERGGVNDYVGPDLAPSGFEDGVADFANPEPAVSFQYPLTEIVQSLVDAGLRIETLREYPYSNGCELFEGMRRLPRGRFGLPEGMPEVPLMFGLVARKA